MAVQAARPGASSAGGLAASGRWRSAAAQSVAWAPRRIERDHLEVGAVLVDRRQPFAALVCRCRARCARRGPARCPRSAPGCLRRADGQRRRSRASRPRRPPRDRTSRRRWSRCGTPGRLSTSASLPSSMAKTRRPRVCSTVNPRRVQAVTTTSCVSASRCDGTRASMPAPCPAWNGSRCSCWYAASRMRVRAACTSPISAALAAVRQAWRPDRRPLGERLFHARELGLDVRPAARGRGRALRTAAPRRRRCRAAAGNRRSRPGCGGRCGRAGRCAARRPTGFHGRSNSTRRRQNSKLRPSPPASVETRRLGPPGSRKRATSRSRRDGGSSSWKAPVASCARWLSAVRSISSVSRCATNTSVFSLRVAPARRLRRQPLDARVRGVHRLAPGLEARARPGRARRRARRPTPARGGCGRTFWRRATSLAAGAARNARFDRLARLPARGISMSIGMPTRGGSPPMSTRRVELVHGGSGRAARRAGPRSRLLGKLLRPQQLQQPEESVRVVFERRRAQEQHVAAEGGDRRDRPPRRLAGMSRRPSQPLRLVHDEQIDAGRHGLRAQLADARSASRARSPPAGAARTG